MREKVIPKIGILHFEFEILRISSWCEIGIGFREMIKQNGYQGDGQGKDHTYQKNKVLHISIILIILKEKHLNFKLMIQQQWK
ncbi:unnamed protein product [Paramecium primaurelia]|uniref:Uncharacterized protein n=1 Tax=Paramecium primaurelia TaxID=5886 RepID=A0A8S1MYF4_PARPR|nr:unnamed protein product [Paramecium primaurelia]CAD8082468.1 unnamed protein product [Paramecium primaurelia]